MAAISINFKMAANNPFSRNDRLNFFGVKQLNKWISDFFQTTKYYIYSIYDILDKMLDFLKTKMAAGH